MAPPTKSRAGPAARSLAFCSSRLSVCAYIGSARVKPRAFMRATLASMCVARWPRQMMRVDLVTLFVLFPTADA